MRKRKLKEIENISFAISYTLTSLFIEEHDRNPTEEEQILIAQKSRDYVFEILYKLKLL